MNRPLRHAALATVAVFVAIAGCSDPNALAKATLDNQVDTLTLWSLTDGPLNEPTAYSLNSPHTLRTWEAGNNFEFAFDETSDGTPVFLPIEVLGLLPQGSVKPGLKRSTRTFDQMTKAPLNGYQGTDTIPIAVGDRFFVRTTISSCSGLGVPLYGKIEILGLDPAAHTVQVRALADQNCGYRGLNLGRPKE